MTITTRSFSLVVARIRWVVGLLAVLCTAPPASGGVIEEINKACDQIGRVAGMMVAPGAPAAFGVPAQLAALTQLRGALDAAVQAATNELETDLKIANAEVARVRPLLDGLDVQGAQEALRIIDRDAEADKRLVREQQQGLRGQRQALAEEWLALGRQLAEKQNESKAELAKPWLARDTKRIEQLNSEASGIGQQIQSKWAAMKALDGDIGLKDQFVAELDANKEAKKAPYRVRIAEGKEKEQRLQTAQKKVNSLVMARASLGMAGWPARSCIEGKIAQLKGGPATDKRGDAGGGGEGNSPTDWAGINKATSDFQGTGTRAGGNAPQSTQEQPSGYRQDPGGGGGIIGKLPPVAWGAGMVPPPQPPGEPPIMFGTPPPSAGQSGGTGSRPPRDKGQAASGTSGACTAPCHMALDGSGKCHCPDAPSAGSSGPTTTKPPSGPVAQGGTPPGPQPGTGTASAKAPIACPALCQKYCMGGVAYEAFTAWRSGPKPADLPQKCTSHCSLYSGVTATEGDTIGGVNQCIRGAKK